MKTLYIVRHAHAGWSNANLPDFERTLSGKGRLEAGEMAHRLHEAGARPDVIISSPATRALETAGIFGDIMGFGSEHIRDEPAIYSGNVDALAGIVSRLPQEYQSAMLFGHNPAVSLYGSWLTGKQLGQMDTCGILRLELPAKMWGAASRASAEMSWYLCPKKHQ
ncbi:MAG: phosphohistidine phosphatase [Chlorobiaceae bacterium]|nr:phosphohistidine phosphatase [Chlorobiaceae bacterium]